MSEMVGIVQLETNGRGFIDLDVQTAFRRWYAGSHLLLKGLVVTRSTPKDGLELFLQKNLSGSSAVRQTANPLATRIILFAGNRRVSSKCFSRCAQLGEVVASISFSSELYQRSSYDKVNKNCLKCKFHLCYSLYWEQSA